MNSENHNIVLVVDDNPDTIGMLNDILVKAGFTVLVALDGQQAMQIALRMKPDIILLDALMPNMSGFETCKKIKKNSSIAHIPVIFMTGLSESEHIEEALDVGGVDPFHQEAEARQVFYQPRRN